MAKKATAKDAELIIQLYDLRREPEMRKARNWWMGEFWPENADDFMKVASSTGTQENNWLRQVAGYWSMAAAFVLSGALNADLFLQPSISGEMYFIFAKIQPFIGEVRAKIGDPNSFRNLETVIRSTKFGRDRLEFTLGRVNQMKERRAANRG
jgi:hypothetical protein